MQDFTLHDQEDRAMLLPSGQRVAMKLMRHSDIRLTAQVYTDEMQLPIYDAIKNLPRLDAVPGYTQIRAQILGGGCNLFRVSGQ